MTADEGSILYNRLDARVASPDTLQFFKSHILKSHFLKSQTQTQPKISDKGQKQFILLICGQFLGVKAPKP
jgi:hypothetical protein